MSTFVNAVRAGAAGVSCYVKGVLGEDAYAKYLAHHASQHSDATGSGERSQVMTEREFWRDHSDRQAQNPQGRSC